MESSWLALFRFITFFMKLGYRTLANSEPEVEHPKMELTDAQMEENEAEDDGDDVEAEKDRIQRHRKHPRHHSMSHTHDKSSKAERIRSTLSFRKH